MEDLSAVLKGLLQKYRPLFAKPFPYMMVVHQAPTDGEDHRYAHLRFEFYTPHRAANRLQVPRRRGVRGRARSSTTSSRGERRGAAAGRAGERRGGCGGGKAGGVDAEPTHGGRAPVRVWRGRRGRDRIRAWPREPHRRAHRLQRGVRPADGDRGRDRDGGARAPGREVHVHAADPGESVAFPSANRSPDPASSAASRARGLCPCGRSRSTLRHAVASTRSCPGPEDRRRRSCQDGPGRGGSVRRRKGHALAGSAAWHVDLTAGARARRHLDPGLDRHRRTNPSL